MWTLLTPRIANLEGAASSMSASAGSKKRGWPP